MPPLIAHVLRGLQETVKCTQKQPAAGCDEHNLCCGKREDKYYCVTGYHCSCQNSSGVVTCPCDAGYSGPNCQEQVSPTIWLAVILTVGTMLVLFIAWGFRCRRDDDDEPFEGAAPPARAGRQPLLREQSDRVLQVANPPSVRATTCTCASEGSVCSRNTDGTPVMEPVRKCVVCLSKPPQVVLIPCGHACVCRKCSRELDTCPICRVEIQASQRFYL